MATTTQKMMAEVEEDQEALFSTYQPYYVQSPSISMASQANSNDQINNPNRETPTSFNLDISHCYSVTSVCSTNSFFNEKNDVKKAGHSLLVISGGGGKEENGRRSGLWRFLSLDPTASLCCIGFQVFWRLVVSLGVALLVFYLATRPPSPSLSIGVIKIGEFDLAEGIDVTGVSTKLLSFNSTMELTIDNQSKVFGLHVHPVTMEATFARLQIASSEANEVYVKAYGTSAMRLHLGTKAKPMYGAGGAMQDLLGSGRGLPLLIHLRSTSTHRVVGDLIRSRFIHGFNCIVTILSGVDSDEEGRNFPAFNTTCSAVTVRRR